MATYDAGLWPVLPYDDAPAMMDWLKAAFGLETTVVIPHPDDPSIVQHAEMRWPLGGGVMIGTAGKDDSEWGRRPSRSGGVYVVTDDPDAVFARATAAGAEVIRGLVDEDFGSRTFTVADPEGNLWSFGTYAGEPLTET